MAERRRSARIQAICNKPDNEPTKPTNKLTASVKNKEKKEVVQKKPTRKRPAKAVITAVSPKKTEVDENNENQASSPDSGKDSIVDAPSPECKVDNSDHGKSSSSDEEMEEQPTRVRKNPRRASVANVKKVQVKHQKDDDDDDESSSSISSDDESDFEVTQDSQKVSDEESSSDKGESVSEENASDEEEEYIVPSKKRAVSSRNNSRPGSRQGNGGGRKGGHCTYQKKKTGTTNQAKTTSTSSRAHVKQKPPKPWQVAIDPLNTKSECVRRLSKGERRMHEVRVFAGSLVAGKKAEMTMDEAAGIIEEMKEAAKNVVKVIQEEEKAEKEKEGERDEDVSSSEDEWEEMEPLDVLDSGNKLEVVLEKEQPANVEPNWWALYLRQEVNKLIRQNWDNTHKAHLLCYIAHLRYVLKTVIADEVVPSLMISQLPSNYLALSGETMTVDRIKKLSVWFFSNFKISAKEIDIDEQDVNDYRYKETAKYCALANAKAYETDRERSALLFALFCGLEAIARIVVNVQPISRKWDDSTENTEKQPKSSKKKNQFLEYWIEVWNSKEKRWICINPISGEVDNPMSIESEVQAPIQYIFAIDNHKGVREVTARYAGDFVKPAFRRMRTDKAWIRQTFNKKLIRADAKRSELEDLHFQTELVQRPLPTTISEYKNHPLYVLERDLLKFEALHPPPEKQKSLGEIRGHKVYPRSTVYQLQGEKQWEKLARSIKTGEKPYKVVKARPNMRIPADQREDKTLDLFGFWQTEPFRPLKVENGRIPRNEFGNVYLYQPVMLPIGTVHLRLSGLPTIARRLNKECVPAVIGWDFHSCSSYPIIEGAVVLKKDEAAFIKEWNRVEAGREEKEKKKRLDRIHDNWRRLIRGIVRLHHVKSKFGNVEKPKKKPAKARNQPAAHVEPPPPSAIIDRTTQAKKMEFTLDQLMK